MYTGVSGSLSAEALFELMPGAGTVTVTLINTAGPSGQKLVPADVLTAVFFNLTGGAVVAPFSAASQPILPAKDAPAGPAGAFWQYKTNLALHGADSGISSTGLGVFQPDGNFDCGAGCGKLNGLDYGIVPASYDRGEGNAGVESVPLIRYSAVFTLTGTVPENAGVDNVWFQYGTALDEPNFSGSRKVLNYGRTHLEAETPEPSPAILVGGRTAAGGDRSAGACAAAFKGFPSPRVILGPCRAVISPS